MDNLVSMSGVTSAPICGAPIAWFVKHEIGDLRVAGSSPAFAWRNF